MEKPKTKFPYIAERYYKTKRTRYDHIIERYHDRFWIRNFENRIRNESMMIVLSNTNDNDESRPKFPQDRMKCVEVTTSILPDDIGIFNDMRYLSVNVLGHGIQFPDSIRYCIQLESLFIKKYDWCSLPSSIEQLTRLRFLGLDGKTLPENIEYIDSLEELQIKESDSIVFPLGMTNLNNLRTLHIDQCNCLPESMKYLTNVVELNLTTSVDVSTISYTSGLAGMISLTKLVLRGRRPILASAVAALPNLENLEYFVDEDYEGGMGYYKVWITDLANCKQCSSWPLHTLNILRIGKFNKDDVAFLLKEVIPRFPNLTNVFLDINGKELTDIAIGRANYEPDTPALFQSGNTRNVKFILYDFATEYPISEKLLEDFMDAYPELIPHNPLTTYIGNYKMNLNYGGRALLFVPKEKVPISIWPVVFERFNNPYRFQCHDFTDIPASTIYYLLRNGGLNMMGFFDSDRTSSTVGRGKRKREA